MKLKQLWNIKKRSTIFVVFWRICSFCFELLWSFYYGYWPFIKFTLFGIAPIFGCAKIVLMKNCEVFIYFVQNDVLKWTSSQKDDTLPDTPGTETVGIERGDSGLWGAYVLLIIWALLVIIALSVIRQYIEQDNNMF